jgi:Uma2 family endonuclease
MSSPSISSPQVEYPDDDGQPMSENTLQFQWIVTLVSNLEAMFADQVLVFVAGDLLWYPVEGQPKIRMAPDALVVFGRAKGYRGSYRQWQEGGIAPQVVFEIQSPGNRPHELDAKFEFYERYGVEEYYLHNPDDNELLGWQRQGESLVPILPMHGWVSPRLGIHFDRSGPELVIYRPDGQPFMTFLELMEQREEVQRQFDLERLAREQAQKRADQERQAKEEAQQKAERLAERLRQLGIDPEK